ncbi:MAG TPA: Gfo/Idh/MocA family oxidoreductase, partial [Caldilineaceae bacterium]|nr:Gfo/Idh/MocA family oxidoreductase [Caldilineaceae bacterium]
MTQIEALDDQLNELATVYAFCRNRRTQLRIGARSIGWGLLGASHVASELIVPAVRRQPSAQDDDSQAGAWVAAVFSHNERRARAFADANQIPMAAVNLTDLLDRPEIRCIYVSSHPRHRYPLIMAAL